MQGFQPSRVTRELQETQNTDDQIIHDQHGGSSGSGLVRDRVISTFYMHVL